MTRPKIGVKEALQLIGQFKFPEKVFLIGIRGYYKDTMGEKGKNDRGIYDDCIILVGPEYYETFNANTDPSRFRAGIATLIPGIHYYKKGLHGISKGNPYPAFRPATPDESLPVTRDGRPGTHKGIAINIHKGGYNTTSSEGCQTIHPDQWQEFLRDTYAQMDLEGQKTIPYILVQG